MNDSTAVARHYRGSRPTCDLYQRGHLVHWVQAKKASEHKFSWGRLEAVEGPIVTVRYLDRVGTYRTHDTAELAFYASIGDKISVCERYGVLRYDIGDRRTLLVGVADADAPFEPCRYRPLERITPDLLAERIRTATTGSACPPAERGEPGALPATTTGDR